MSSVQLARGTGYYWKHVGDLPDVVATTSYGCSLSSVRLNALGSFCPDNIGNQTLRQNRSGQTLSDNKGIVTERLKQFPQDFGCFV